MPTPKTIVFKRSQWIRGSLVDKPNNDGSSSYCAIGFCMNRMGVSDLALWGDGVGILDKSLAQAYVNAGLEWLVCPFYRDDAIMGFRPSDAMYNIIQINDRERDPVVRESRLREIFAAHEIELRFKD